MPDTNDLYDRTGRYHVNNYGPNVFYINHITCTDNDCRREHYYLLSYDGIADIVAKYVHECAGADKPAIWSDDHSVEYYIVSGDDAARAKHERSCPYSCPHADYFRGREEKSSGNRG